MQDMTTEQDVPAAQKAAAGTEAAAGESVFQWKDAFLLGHQQMDETHQEFVELVNKLLVVPDEEFLPALKEFRTHAESHFSQEDEWMKSTAFPPRDCHIKEHAAVLSSVVEVVELLEEGGKVSTGRSLARELMNWFPGHADYLDSALAQWITKKKMGGVPVVLRRGTQSCDVPVSGAAPGHDTAA